MGVKLLVYEDAVELLVYEDAVGTRVGDCIPVVSINIGQRYCSVQTRGLEQSNQSPFPLPTTSVNCEFVPRLVGTYTGSL